MTLRKIIKLICIFAVTINVGAVSIDPPKGSQIFVVKKSILDTSYANGNFETGTLSYWSKVNLYSSEIVVTNKIPAADGEYYAEMLSYGVDGARSQVRMDQYVLRNVTTPENGRIFRFRASIYFPETEGNIEPAQFFNFQIGVNNENTWVELMGSKSVWAKNVPLNEWYDVEFYFQTDQEIFTGLSPRINFITDLSDGTKSYRALIDNIVIEQGVYRSNGTFLYIIGGSSFLCYPEEPIDILNLQTPLNENSFDQAAYTEWVNGVETLIVEDDDERSSVPEHIVLVDQDILYWKGIYFGTTNVPGVRHLRIGLDDLQTVGTILTVGNVSVSVLKEDVVYPGDISDDDQWIPALRFEDNALTTSEGEDSSAAILWTLPNYTKTRALRFTHTASAADESYDGVLRGAYVMHNRYANIALQANTTVRSNSADADLITNDSMDGFWSVWENVDVGEDRLNTIEEDPEWFITYWDESQSISGLSFFFPGFREADIQIYTGPEERHPTEAEEDDWQTVKYATGIENLYPCYFGLNLIDFDSELTTRALRIRITAPEIESLCHSHIQSKLNDGERVWLGEMQVLKSMRWTSLDTLVVPEQRVANKAIPINFTLPEDGYVTLVVDDEDGDRVYNLISDTFFTKGANTVYWYGIDDLARDEDAADHGLYSIPEQFVEPGNYTVRGLWHEEVKLSYEFGVYNNGHPPWITEDHTGAWLANHSAPSAAMFVPSDKSPTGVPTMFLGCYVTEGPDGLGWFDLTGKKLGGVKWIGGNWTAAPYLGRDMGTQALDGVCGYVASVWDDTDTSVELRITPFTEDNDGNTVIVSMSNDDESDKTEYIAGIAVYNSIAVCSIPKLDKIIFVNTETGVVDDEFAVNEPAGLAYKENHDLYVISGNQLLSVDTSGTEITADVVISSGLEEPVAVTVDTNGLIYISDRGNSHQVKVFSSDGNFVRAIGTPGIPCAGTYDPLHMNNPAGIAIDSENQLWVTEEDYIPKRVSMWSLDGTFIKAFYGPTKYGGGGVIDETDKKHFYYADEENGTMEFILDWTNGTSQLTNVLFRYSDDNLVLPFRNAAPETAIYRTITDDGQELQQRYFINCYNSSPTGGSSSSFVFIERDGKLYPVAGIGKGMEWLDILSQSEFASLIPDGIDLDGDSYSNPFIFIWSDLNGDSDVQPNEVSLHAGVSGGITIKKDLSFCIARFGEDSDNQNAYRFRPIGFTDDEVPIYDFTQKEVLVEGTQNPASTGGDQVLVDDDGNMVVALGIKPYDRLSLSGGKDGVPTWSYPNLWPGLHASHNAAKPTFSGEVIGATRLLGDYFEPENSEVGALWAINGNMGNIYVFTMDGLFVSTLFEDVRLGTLWRMPAEERYMDLEGISLHDENFWPSITKTSDGNLYLMSGETTCIVDVDGLDDIYEIAPMSLNVTSNDLMDAQEQMIIDEALRKAEEGSGVMDVVLNTFVPTVDGNIDEWPDTWVEIEKSGDGANFNSTAEAYDYQGVVTISGTNFFAAWKTADKDLLENSGEIDLVPFKTGGTLELMIGTDENADSLRMDPVEGDIRLSVTIVDDETYAVLYVPVDTDATTDPFPFSSPWRTIEFDRVEDVSEYVQLAADGEGNYEISIPLDVLGLVPYDGMRIAGDIGLLRGNGYETLARIYWSNKATAIVSDVPSEAQLLPALWGIFEFNE